MASILKKIKIFFLHKDHIKESLDIELIKKWEQDVKDYHLKNKKL